MNQKHKCRPVPLFARILLLLALTLPLQAQGAPRIDIAPAAGEAGNALFDISISGLAADSAYTVDIVFQGEVVFSSQERSDSAGEILYPVRSTADDVPGIYTVRVLQAGSELASASMELTAPASITAAADAGAPQAPALILMPAAVAAGDAVEIMARGVMPAASLTLQITSADAVLIDTLAARASADGAARLSFRPPAHLADGAYWVDLFVEGERQARKTLTIGALAASVSISPRGAPIGSEHLISVSGLPAAGEFSLLILDPAGVEAYRSQRVADATGAFALQISSTEEDAPGRYTVQARTVSGEALAAADFEITLPAAAVPAPASTASAIISPAAAPLGSSHRITVSGLEAGEIVTFDVVFAGASVYQSEKIADADGAAQIELFTSADDPAGEYSITALRAAGNQPMVLLTAKAISAAPAMDSDSGGAQIISGSLQAGRAEVIFTGSAEQYSLITVAADDDFDPAAALLDRSGERIAFNDDSRELKNASIGPLRLPYSGEYRLDISAAPLMMPRAAEIGEFTVSIEMVTLAHIPPSGELRFTLDSMAPARYYALPVAAGERLSISADSGGSLDTQLQVVSPGGEEFAFDDDSGSALDAELSNLVFDRAGSYILALSSFEAGASGEGTLNIRREAPPSLDSGDALVTLNDKMVRDMLVFEAAAGESLVLNLQKRAGDVADLIVRATVEGMEVMSYSTMGVPAELPLAFVMPMSGLVAVTLEKIGVDDSIELGVSLQRA